MKNYRIAVLGSTGVVGREMIRLIEAGGIPAELVPLGSARSAGSSAPSPQAIRARRRRSPQRRACRALSQIILP